MGLIALINKLLEFVKTKPRLHHYFLRVGIFIATKRCLGLLVMILKKMLDRQIVLIHRYGSGSWAVVTGAAGGIGQSFSIKLAKQGFNIIGIDCNQENLLLLQKEIVNNVKRSFQGIIVDFKNAVESKAFQRIKVELSNVDVSILVNNVGIAEVYRYEEYPVEKMYDMVNVNIMPQMIMTNLVLPNMLKRRNVKSAIISMSSISAELVPSYLPVYAGTKAFNQVFSESLDTEFSDRNIDFLSATPYFITTDMTLNKKEFLWIEADEFVNSVLQCLGQTNHTYGHWKHQFAKTLASILPEKRAQKHAGNRAIEQVEQLRQGKQQF